MTYYNMFRSILIKSMMLIMISSYPSFVEKRGKNSSKRGKYFLLFCVNADCGLGYNIVISYVYYIADAVNNFND